MFTNDNRFFDDLAKAATGAVGALSGIRQQIQNEIKAQMNRFIIEMDFVPREDFEIVEAMARETSIKNQKLEARIAELEKRAGIKTTSVKSAPKAQVKTKSKTAAKKTKK